MSFHLKMYVIADAVLVLKMSFLMSLFAVVEFLPDGLSYYPILYFNDYWNLNQDYMPINSSTKSVFSIHATSFDWFTVVNVFCPTSVDNIWAAITFWEISGKIVGNVLCCIFVISKLIWAVFRDGLRLTCLFLRLDLGLYECVVHGVS